MTDHSYEEIRAAALDILAGREKTGYVPQQYEELRLGVEELIIRRDPQCGGVSTADNELFLEVFWELFRQGIITLGLNHSNKDFPFFRVSHFGKKILASQNAYFFHDVSDYTKIVQASVPQIDSTTLVYLQEAMQAFRSDCILSSTVMLGVATEHTFVLLLETIEKSATWKPVFQKVGEQKTILQKVNKFKNILDQKSKKLPKSIREDLDTHFAGILSIIRNFRNQSGHPTGKIVGREQAYVLLQLFAPYCRKMYELMAHFGKS